MFYATNKLRHSTYFCTPSGKHNKAKALLCSVCPFCIFFSYPLQKGCKKTCVFFQLPFAFIAKKQMYFSAQSVILFLCKVRYHIVKGNSDSNIIYQGVILNVRNNFYNSCNLAFR